jgi:hypothetical protein
MTLPTQNDVRRAKTADALERYVVKRLDEDLEPRDESTENSPDFTGACSLAIDSVVDEID